MLVSGAGVCDGVAGGEERREDRYRTVIRKNTGPEYGQKKKRTIGQ